jgi:hypothetical protein
MFLEEKRLAKLHFADFSKATHRKVWNKKVTIIHGQNVLVPAGFDGTSDASVKWLRLLSLKQTTSAAPAHKIKAKTLDRIIITIMPLPFLSL